MIGPNDDTPVKKQTTLDLVLEGVNDIKTDVNDIKLELSTIRSRTDNALNLAFEAHQKAKTALWSRHSWGPYVVAALALAISLSTAAFALAGVVR